MNVFIQRLLMSGGICLIRRRVKHICLHACIPPPSFQKFFQSQKKICPEFSPPPPPFSPQTVREKMTLILLLLLATCKNAPGIKETKPSPCILSLFCPAMSFTEREERALGDFTLPPSPCLMSPNGQEWRYWTIDKTTSVFISAD